MKIFSPNVMNQNFYGMPKKYAFLTSYPGDSCAYRACCSCCLVTVMFDSFENPWTISPPGYSIHGISQARIPTRVLPFPSPGDLPDSGIEPMSPGLAGRLFTTEPPRKPIENLGPIALEEQEVPSIIYFFLISQVHPVLCLEPGWFSLIASWIKEWINLTLGGNPVMGNLPCSKEIIGNFH